MTAPDLICSIVNKSLGNIGSASFSLVAFPCVALPANVALENSWFSSSSSVSGLLSCNRDLMIREWRFHDWCSCNSLGKRSYAYPVGNPVAANPVDYIGTGCIKSKNQKWKYALWHWYSSMKINFMKLNLIVIKLQ